MRKLPASEQPTQLSIRDVTYDPSVILPPRRHSKVWVMAGLFALFVCLGMGLLAALGLQSASPNLLGGEDITFEVVEREQPRAAISEPIAAINTSGKLSPIFTPEVQFWGPLIVEWGAAWEIDPNLIATLIQIESCGDHTVSSSAGAQGLFQVMPFHFDPGEDMLDITNNAQRGLNYLNGGLDLSEGHAGLALAGYNGGHSVIRRGYAAWYAETRRYYYWGAGIYQDATQGLSQSTRLQEWLAAGGQALCDRASRSQSGLSVEQIVNSRRTDS